MGLEDSGRCVFCRGPKLLNPQCIIKVEDGLDVFKFLCNLFQFSCPDERKFESGKLSNSDFCRNCHVLIQNAISICNQIEVLQHNLDTIKTNLQEIIVSSCHHDNNNIGRKSSGSNDVRKFFMDRWNLMKKTRDAGKLPKVGTYDPEQFQSPEETKNVLVAFTADGMVVQGCAELTELSDNISIPSDTVASEESQDHCDEGNSTMLDGKWIGHSLCDHEDESNQSESSDDCLFQKRKSSKKSRLCARKPFVCYFCNEGFTLVRNLNRHVLKIHGDAAVFTCPLCGLNFQTEQSPGNKEESSNQDYPYFCRINDCKRRFQTLAELRSHHLIKCADFFESNENAVTMLSCGRCAMLFSTENDLRYHINSMHGTASEVISRSRYWPLKEERGTQSESNRPHPKLPTEKPHTIAGVKREPNEVVPFDSHRHTLEDSNYLTETYKCFHCPKRFLTDHGRRQHGKVHQNVKPLSCAVCYEGFTMLCNLRRHVLKAHCGSLQEACPLCGIGFTHVRSRSSLQNDTFVCNLPECNRSFQTLGDLQTHHLAECPEVLKLKGLTSR